MNINLSKIKLPIIKYIKEYEKMKTHNIELEYLPKIPNSSIANKISNILDSYIDNILLEYQIKNVKKDISNKKKTNILNVNQSKVKLEEKCTDLKNLKLIGEGFFGKVFEIDKNKVVKMTKLSTLFVFEKRKNILQLIKNEYQISKKAGELKVGPKVYNHFICKTDQGYYHLMIMENIKDSKTLKEWLEGNPSEIDKKKIEKKIEKKLKILHKNGIIHDDLYRGNGNILIKKNNQDVIIIDYGISQKSNNYLKNKLDEEKEYIMKIFQDNINMKQYIKEQLLKNKELRVFI